MEIWFIYNREFKGHFNISCWVTDSTWHQVILTVHLDYILCSGLWLQYSDLRPSCQFTFQLCWHPMHPYKLDSLLHTCNSVTSPSEVPHQSSPVPSTSLVWNLLRTMIYHMILNGWFPDSHCWVWILPFADQWCQLLVKTSFYGLTFPSCTCYVSP